MILFFLSLLFFLISYVFPPVLAVAVFCLGSFLMNLSLFRASLHNDTYFVAYKSFGVFYIVQPVCFAVCTVLYPDLTKEMCVNTDIYSGGHFSLFYSFNLILIVIWLVSLRMRGKLRRMPPGNGIRYFIDQQYYGIDVLLFLAGIISILDWFQAFFPQHIGYAIRVAQSVVAIAPLIVGLRVKRAKFVTFTWLIILAFNVFAGVVSGNRGVAFWPVILFLSGFYIQLLHPGRKLLMVGVLLVMLVPGTLLMGFIAELRNQLGRGAGLAGVNIQEVIQEAPRIYDELFAHEGFSDDNSDSPGYMAVNRLVDWTLVFVPNMTPDPVTFRGYRDIGDELQGMFAFMGADKTTVAGSFYPTQLFARRYGFNVFIQILPGGKRHSFTVPFAILADSWSRWGLVSSFFQVYLYLSIIVFLEQKIRQKFQHIPEMAMFMTFLLVENSFRLATVYGITFSIRRLSLMLAAGGLMCWGIAVTCRIMFADKIKNAPSHPNGHGVPCDKEEY